MTCSLFPDSYVWNGRIVTISPEHSLFRAPACTKSIFDLFKVCGPRHACPLGSCSSNTIDRDKLRDTSIRHILDRR